MIEKITHLKKAFEKSGEKKTRTELNQLQRAEKLYLNAARKAGDMRLVKFILAQNPELGEEGIDFNAQIRYNKKTPYIQWKSDALAWANTHSTKIGDMRSGADSRFTYFYEAYDPDGDGRATDYRVIARVSHRNQRLINDWYAEVKKSNERNHTSLYERVDVYESARREHQSDNGTLLEEASTNGRVGSVHQGESEGNGKRNSRKGNGNSEVRYSLKDTVEQDALSHYGKTYNWQETGYIYDDGTRLDLSEEHDPNIKFSRKPFAKQVDSVLSGADTNSTHLLVLEKTPQLLQEAGFPDLPILLTAKHLKSIVNKTGKGNVNYHGLPEEIVKKLPEYISDPVVIADSLTRDDSIVVVTEAVDSEDRPIIAAILLEGDGRIEYKHIKANIITSAYGKDNFASFIKKFADNNTVIYWNKKKSQDLSVSLGIQFPNAITSLDSDTIIRKAKAFVNKKSKKTSENSSETKFSRKSQETGSSTDKYFKNLSDGQIKKILANMTRTKVYSRKESEKLINDIIASLPSSDALNSRVNIKGKSRSEVVGMLWRAFNTVDPPAKKQAASDIADYIISHSVVENVIRETVEAPEQDGELVEKVKTEIETAFNEGMTEEEHVKIKAEIEETVLRGFKVFFVKLYFSAERKSYC